MVLTCPQLPHRPDQSLDNATVVGHADEVAYVVKAFPERGRRGRDVAVSQHQMVMLISPLISPDAGQSHHVTMQRQIV